MKYRSAIEGIMRRRRPLLMEHWGNAPIVAQKESSIVTIVTATDIEMEEIVSEELAKEFPDIPFVGEECGGDRIKGTYWLMDPIDGTQHYMRGLPFCTAMLALIEDGKVRAGAVYDFINDIFYYAEPGEGAWKNDERISVSTRTVKEAYISWETRLANPENRKIVDEIYKRMKVVKTISAGWELVMVAEGKLDARLSFDPHWSDYDYAPGTLIVSEAGGVIANIGSREFDIKNPNIIATNPLIFKELTEGGDALFPITKG
jgi:myo-inositol-1(or 4)-monophosphatase